MRLMRRNSWIALLVILIAWGRMGSNAFSLEYELMGEVEYGSGDSLPKCSVNFRVAVSGANWLITITNCHRPDSVRLSAGFPDYGNIHIVFLRQEEAPPAVGDRSKTEVLISKTARVERYGYPAKAYDRVTQLLCFAFASHTMANGANIPPPLWDLLDATEGGQNPSEARHFESPLPLPRQAVFFSDGYLARSKISVPLVEPISRTPVVRSRFVMSARMSHKLAGGGLRGGETIRAPPCQRREAKKCCGGNRERDC
jgi:hypothetical protein